MLTLDPPPVLLVPESVGVVVVLVDARFTEIDDVPTNSDPAADATICLSGLSSANVVTKALWASLKSCSRINRSLDTTLLPEISAKTLILSDSDLSVAAFNLIIPDS